MARKVKLVDITKCCACKGCQTACKNWNQLPGVETEFVGSYENPADFCVDTWCRVKFNEYDEDGIKWYFTKYQCMHCTDAGCIAVCPVNSLVKTEMETVKNIYDECIACGACVPACPFDVPRGGDVMMKCTLCFDRIGHGMTPACARTCPTGAVSFGDLDDKIAEAEDRLGELQERGHPNPQIYGKDELDGLGVIYVLPDDPDKCGLPAEPEISATTYFWNIALKPVKTLAAVGISIGFMNNFIKKKAEEKTKQVQNQEMVE